LQLPELKLIVASNIINLRAGAGLTQAQLGEKLNYSDKSISKWERGEAIPDAYVLLQMAEIFGVSVDFILSSHDSWEPPAEEEEIPSPTYSVNAIIAIAVLGVMTVALAVFVTLWALDILEWRIFPVGFTVAVITYLVLDCVFRHARHLEGSLMVLELCLLLDVFFLAPGSPWQIFLLVIPTYVITALSFRVKTVKGGTLLGNPPKE